MAGGAAAGGAAAGGAADEGAAAADGAACEPPLVEGVARALAAHLEHESLRPIDGMEGRLKRDAADLPCCSKPEAAEEAAEAAAAAAALVRGGGGEGFRTDSSRGGSGSPRVHAPSVCADM